MTEGEAHQVLCDAIDNLCDCWQMGEVNDQEFVRLFAQAGQLWLDDQIKHSPKL